MKGGNELPRKRAGGLYYFPESSSWDMQLELDLKQCCSTVVHHSSFKPNSSSFFFDQIAKKSTSLVWFYLKINAGLWLLLLFQLMPEPGITSAPGCLWGLAPACGVWQAEHPHRASSAPELGVQSPKPVFNLDPNSCLAADAQGSCSQPEEPSDADALPRP